jgi:hypothetical protein
MHSALAGNPFSVFPNLPPKTKEKKSMYVVDQITIGERKKRKKKE